MPSCELLVNRHTGSKIEVFRATLFGAKEPNNFFCIECHPEIAGTNITKVNNAFISGYLLCIPLHVCCHHRVCYISLVSLVTARGAGSVLPTSAQGRLCSTVLCMLQIRRCLFPTASQIPDELEVKNAISNVNNWFNLGEQLKMEFSVLEAILRDYAVYGTGFQRSKMVNTWLKRDPAASWSKLCGALERVGEGALAQVIREKHP